MGCAGRMALIEGRAMLLLIVYIVLMLLGDALAYLIGFVIERPHVIGLTVERSTTTISLAVFLLCYFLNLWLAWLIAVKITAPRPASAAAA
jgi:dolichol kinase